MSLEQLKARAAEKSRKEEEERLMNLKKRDEEMKKAAEMKNTTQSTQSTRVQEKKEVAPVKAVVKLDVNWGVDLRRIARVMSLMAMMINGFSYE